MDTKEQKSSRGLLLAAVKRFGLGIVLLGGFLFLFAGDFGFWNAWLYLGTLAVAIFPFGLYLYTRDQQLLRKRLNAKEKEKAQRAYGLFTSVSFLATFAVCGLDYRFGWSRMPLWLVLAALGLMLAGYGLFVATLMQNRFASRVVEVQQGQRVIQTGLYSVIRHPMYAAALLLFCASPFVLGSYYGAIPMLLYPVGIVLRIGNEEKVLRQGLEGYGAYMEKVKYRLIPFVW